MRGGYRPGAGRKKGSKATHTLEAEKFRELLIKRVQENAEPIIKALIDKAKSGDVNAIRELFDRALGKARQNIGLDGGEEDKPIVIEISKEIAAKNKLYDIASDSEGDSEG